MKSAATPRPGGATDAGTSRVGDATLTGASLVVEFAGRAGVGKSTIAERLEESLAASGIPTRPATRDRMPFLARFRPVDFLRVLRIGWALRLSPVSWATAARCVGAYKEVVRLRVCLATPGVYVLDQGLVQYLQQLKALRPSPRERLGAYHRALRGLPVPTHLVVVTCPPEPLVARKRADGRAETTAAREEAFRRASTLADDARFLASTRASHGFAVAFVENRTPNDVETIADDVAHLILAELRRNGAASG